jgi:hypothetical protein
MGKMTLTVLAGVLLITPAAVSASTAGMEAATQSVVDSTSPPVVLALAAGHSIIVNTGGAEVPNPKIHTPQCWRPCGHLKSASPEVFAKGMLRKVDSCRRQC